MPSGSKPQILLVDDEPGIRKSLKLLLMSIGYDVAVAENGVSALSQLNQMVPDLIVTDINMPKMSGIELIAHVRSRYPSISIVAMSGGYQEEEVRVGLADVFYTKGQPPNDLVTAIATLIAANPAHDGLRKNRSRLALES
jgi:CheY-like chemotaxis protein